MACQCPLKIQTHHRVWVSLKDVTIASPLTIPGFVLTITSPPLAPWYSIPSLPTRRRINHRTFCVVDTLAFFLPLSSSSYFFFSSFSSPPFFLLLNHLYRINKGDVFSPIFLNLCLLSIPPSFSFFISQSNCTHPHASLPPLLPYPSSSP